MASWIFQSNSRTTGIYSNEMMTYFQLAIRTLALGNENCAPWETRTATSTKDFRLFLVPVCVVCKSVILSCLTINHVWNLGCASGVELPLLVPAWEAEGCQDPFQGIHGTATPAALHFALGMRLTIYWTPCRFLIPSATKVPILGISRGIQAMIAIF